MSDLSKIDHVAIVVNDIADSVKWYQEQFKCEIEYQDESWAFLKFNNIKLALVLEEQHPAHFAILTPEPEKYGPPKHHRDGSRSTYIQDPDENYVEMLSYE